MYKQKSSPASTIFCFENSCEIIRPLRSFILVFYRGVDFTTFSIQLKILPPPFSTIHSNFRQKSKQTFTTVPITVKIIHCLVVFMDQNNFHLCLPWKFRTLHIYPPLLIWFTNNLFSMFHFVMVVFKVQNTIHLPCTKVTLLKIILFSIPQFTI